MPLMTALLLTAPATFSFVSVPRPDAATLAPGEVLVRVLAGGICGSDVPFFRSGTASPSGEPPPCGFPMHEIVGEVVGSGPVLAGRQPFAHGTRVVGWASLFDGLAEYVVTDADGLAPSPAHLAAEDAVVIQPLACVLYAVERLGDLAGKRCAVIGLGSIGVLFCHVLKQRGAGVVVGVDLVDRSGVAAEFGIDQVVWASSARWSAELADGTRPDVVIEAVGHQVSTLHHALSAVAPCGVVFYFGVFDDPVYPLDMSLMLRKNLTLMSGGTLERRRVLEAASDYLDRHPDLAKHVVTHRFGRADIQAAYEIAARPAVGRLKVVVSMPTG